MTACDKSEPKTIRHTPQFWGTRAMSLTSFVSEIHSPDVLDLEKRTDFFGTRPTVRCFLVDLGQVGRATSLAALRSHKVDKDLKVRHVVQQRRITLRWVSFAVEEHMVTLNIMQRGWDMNHDESRSLFFPIILSLESQILTTESADVRLFFFFFPSQRVWRRSCWASCKARRSCCGPRRQR